jgi:hypothetical protein
LTDVALAVGSGCVIYFVFDFASYLVALRAK